MNSELFHTDIFIIPEDKSAQFSIPDEVELICIGKHEDLAKNSMLLTNILKAVGYKLGVNAISVELEPEDSVKLTSLAQEKLEYILCFGTNPKELGMNARFKANRFYKTESFNILLTHSLDQLDGDVRRKKALWTALQTQFKND